MAKATLDLRKYNADMKKYKRRLKNMRPILNKIGSQQVDAAKKRIKSTKINPEGQRWAPWSYATLAGRIRTGKVAGGLLYLSGRLYRSFKISVSRVRLKITNTAPYSIYLQEGTNNMPARSFLGLVDGDKKKISNIILKWIKRGR